MSRTISKNFNVQPVIIGSIQQLRIILSVNLLKISIYFQTLFWRTEKAFYPLFMIVSRKKIIILLLLTDKFFPFFYKYLPSSNIFFICKYKPLCNTNFTGMFIFILISGVRVWKNRTFYLLIRAPPVPVPSFIILKDRSSR